MEADKAGRCACEIKNPQGSCCLGNVAGVVEALGAEPVVPAPGGSYS